MTATRFDTAVANRVLTAAVRRAVYLTIAGEDRAVVVALLTGAGNSAALLLDPEPVR